LPDEGNIFDVASSFAGATTASFPQTVPALRTFTVSRSWIVRLRRWMRTLFDVYNMCNLEKYASLLADNVEFYHDQGGLMAGNKAVKQNICGKAQRVLVAGTLEVYPMKGFGAVEIGVHRVAHPW
jgi:hypothetical protein